MTPYTRGRYPAPLARRSGKSVVRHVALGHEGQPQSLVQCRHYARRHPRVEAHFEIHVHDWTEVSSLHELATSLDADAVTTLVDELYPESTDVFRFSTEHTLLPLMAEVARQVRARNPLAILVVECGEVDGSHLLTTLCANYVMSRCSHRATRTFLLGLLDGDVGGVLDR